MNAIFVAERGQTASIFFGFFIQFVASSVANGHMAATLEKIEIKMRGPNILRKIALARGANRIRTHDPCVATHWLTMIWFWYELRT